MSLQQGPLDLAEMAGTVAVITGCANRGIGWGLCKQCAEMGMSVALVDLHQHMVDAAAAELGELYPGTRSAAIECDVGDASSMGACLDAVLTSFPGVPIGAVFANAGVIFNKTILRSRIEDFELTLRVNVIGVVNTIQAFVPVLQQQDTPSVMCSTASVGGISRGDGGGAAYQGSKAAIVSISETLSFELARRYPQVRVHVLCPCQVQSNLGVSSVSNRAAAAGHEVKLEAPSKTKAEGGETAVPWFAQTTEDHARQVWDRIAQPEFYIVTDSVRPWTDNDFPFDGQSLVRERMEGIVQGTLDNSDAFADEPRGWPVSPDADPETAPPSAILKGPMFKEMWRRHAKAKEARGKL